MIFLKIRSKPHLELKWYLNATGFGEGYSPKTNFQLDYLDKPKRPNFWGTYQGMIAMFRLPVQNLSQVLSQ